MKNCSFLVVTFIVLLSTSVFSQSDSFRVAGVMRNFIVHAPSGLSNPPLVFILHGYSMDAALMVYITQMDKIADRDKFIVVYPNAINKSWNSSGPDDFTFLLAIIDTLNARYHIDLNRVYASGFSQGGFLTFTLGCKYSDVFAAIAPVSGHHTVADCALKRPVPMFCTFGTKDAGVTNGDVSSFMKDVATWMKLDSCTGSPKRTSPYPSSNPNSVITQVVYGPCAQGTEVMYDSVVGGPHEWPMDTKTKVNTSEEVWAFFKRFSRTSITAIHEQTLSTTRKAISVSYSSGIVRLLGVGEKARVRVTDTKGRLVEAAIAERRQFVLKDKSSGVYIIMVTEENRPFALRMVIP